MNLAQRAREEAGLTLKESARRAGICEAYLRRCERNASMPYPLARKLSAIYHAPIDAFIPHRKEGSKTPKKRSPAHRGRS